MEEAERMIDNHDDCEWVNVSSGTGSPGLSRTKSKEPKNGCVCVCVAKLIWVSNTILVW